MNVQGNDTEAGFSEDEGGTIITLILEEETEVQRGLVSGLMSFSLSVIIGEFKLWSI